MKCIVNNRMIQLLSLLPWGIQVVTFWDAEFLGNIPRYFCIAAFVSACLFLFFIKAKNHYKELCFPFGFYCILCDSLFFAQNCV